MLGGLYHAALYLILKRHEGRKEYFQEILDSIEHDDIEGLYEICFGIYNEACEEIEVLKQKIIPFEQKLDKSKSIMRLLKYNHLMEELNLKVIRRDIYKGYLNYHNIKRYGREWPNWSLPVEELFMFQVNHEIPKVKEEDKI